MTDRNSTIQNPPTQPKKRGGNRKPMTTEQYLAKARKKHGPKFDYSLVAYKHSAKPITIICPTHGNFEQKAHEHLRSKYGCQECAKEIAAEGKKLTTAEFIKNAKAKHGSKFDYSKSVYVDNKTDVEIICPVHGPFFRTANNHISGGYGCNECAGVPTYDTEYFIKRAKEAHKARGSEYDYSKVEYVSCFEPVEIVCGQHGSFFQAPHEHLKPRGCPECGNILGGGWSRSDFIAKCKANNNGNATLYVVKCSKGAESFYKVGVTSRDVKWRFKSKRNMPYNYKTVFEIEADGGYIYDLEVTLHSILKDNRHDPLVDFRGKTECFSTIKPIESLLKELTTTEQMQLIA